jgi:Zn-dependent peptidase ImmA (M78 family)
MATHVPLSPSVLLWALDRGGRSVPEARARFKRLDAWLDPGSSAGPTPSQLEQFATFTGVPFGYLLLPQPPDLSLPIADFREGQTGGRAAPSIELLAVLYQSIRRQQWYRMYAIENSLPPVQVVGAGRNRAPTDVATEMRDRLNFGVDQRSGSWSDTRRYLLAAFEDLGGLTVTTSMVENNTHRPLDPDEFRGFSLVDDIAPLVFVNATQTLNGQIFTLAHEFAHIWRGTSGISAEDPRRDPETEVEAWCNAAASEFLVPQADLVRRYDSAARRERLPERLDHLAGIYRCGTLVVLQAIRRAQLENFADFTSVYDNEVDRLQRLSEARGRSGGGDHYLNQPYRVGDRLSRAVIADAIEGRTTLTEALGLMSMKSLKTFDEYARRLGVVA